MVLEDYQHLTHWKKEKPARCFSVLGVCTWIKRFGSTDAHQLKIKVVFLMPVTSQHVLEEESYIFSFPQEF